MDIIVQAAGISKSWGQIPALTGVSMTVTRGVTGLLGANGAGKTTLIGLLLGLSERDAGTLTVLGADPASSGPEIRARLGYAPEHDALPPETRAQDFVRHVAELHGLPPSAAVARASETLDLVGLGEERLREVGTLSLGQRQRVKIAQAIAHDPGLVLLDEPTNGLDPLQRDDMLDTIRRIGHDLDIPVLVSSHLIHEVESICDTVVVLDSGRVQASGQVSTMIEAGDRVLVELDEDAGALAAALDAAGVVVDRTGPTRLVVTVGHAEILDVVRDEIAKLGAGLRRLAPIRATLEERFFAPQQTRRR